MRKVLLFATVMLLLLSHYSFSQDKQITGVIRDAKDNSPLPGVTVRIKGSNTGTVSAKLIMERYPNEKLYIYHFHPAFFY